MILQSQKISDSGNGSYTSDIPAVWAHFMGQNKKNSHGRYRLPVTRQIKNDFCSYYDIRRYSRSYVYSETSRWTYDRTTGLAKVGHIPMTVSMKWYPVTADIPAAAYAMGTKETVANVMD